MPHSVSRVIQTWKRADQRRTVPYDLNPIWSLRQESDLGVLQDETRAESFTDFATEVEPRMRCAVTAAWGDERGREAAAEELESPCGVIRTLGAL